MGVRALAIYAVTIRSHAECEWDGGWNPLMWQRGRYFVSKTIWWRWGGVMRGYLCRCFALRAPLNKWDRVLLPLALLFKRTQNLLTHKRTANATSERITFLCSHPQQLENCEKSCLFPLMAIMWCHRNHIFVATLINECNMVKKSKLSQEIMYKSEMAFAKMFSL